jgi:hypothetical protein
MDDACDLSSKKLNEMSFSGNWASLAVSFKCVIYSYQAVRYLFVLGLRGDSFNRCRTSSLAQPSRTNIAAVASAIMTLFRVPSFEQLGCDSNFASGACEFVPGR